MNDGILILRNLILTLPSIIYHGSVSIVERFRHNSAEDIIFNVTDTNNLILLIHGYHGLPCNFVPLIDNILSINTNIKNQWNIVAVSLNKFKDYGQNTIENETDIILKYLNDNSKYDNVILIGLSKGGLVCSNVYTKYSDKINRVITISSPLKGTKSCDIFVPKFLDKICGNLDNMRQDLGYESDISLDICHKIFECPDSNLKFYHIVTKYDHMVYPSHSSQYDLTIEKNIYRYDGMIYSHVGLPFSKKIAQQIVNWIT